MIYILLFKLLIWHITSQVAKGGLISLHRHFRPTEDNTPDQRYLAEWSQYVDTAASPKLEKYGLVRRQRTLSPEASLSGGSVCRIRRISRTLLVRNFVKLLGMIGFRRGLGYGRIRGTSEALGKGFCGGIGFFRWGNLGLWFTTSAKILVTVLEIFIRILLEFCSEITIVSFLAM